MCFELLFEFLGKVKKEIFASENRVGNRCTVID